MVKISQEKCKINKLRSKKNFQKQIAKMESKTKYWEEESLKQIYVSTTKGFDFYLVRQKNLILQHHACLEATK